MNNRIKELAYQANLYVNIGDSDCHWPRHMGAEESDEAYKKFAELIVKECMEVAGASYTSTPEDCVYYVDLAVNRIAEHFGVEE